MRQNNHPVQALAPRVRPRALLPRAAAARPLRVRAYQVLRRVLARVHPVSPARHHRVRHLHQDRARLVVNLAAPAPDHPSLLKIPLLIRQMTMG